LKSKKIRSSLVDVAAKHF